MFAAAGLVLIAKINLLPHVEFDLGRALASLRAVNPGVTALPLSARTGEGMAQWYGWLSRRAQTAREAGLL
jgi:hydrogenase nickel incorporation protein HypB